MKIEIRKNCKECGKPIVKKRFRIFCSTQCRNKFRNKKKYQYYLNWARNKRNKEAEIPDDNKIQCKICGRWYRQVGSHVYWRHEMTAREYREKYGFDVKKGQLPEDLRKLFGQQALENGTYKNLKNGAKYQFKKGDKVGTYKRSSQTLERIKLMGLKRRKNYEKS